MAGCQYYIELGNRTATIFKAGKSNSLKKVLIISPYFPPVNTADMHRVRQGLPYFRQLGWEPVVITVDEAYTESYSRDELLLHTIPSDIKVHRVKALKTKYTRKVGLGSLSMRAYFNIRRKGNELLRKDHFDLVYFSTTAFHVMALGPEWKRKFKVPFVVDIQDPWRNDFYLDKPKSERPPKFFIAYNIDKYLEAKTIPFADGIISVSQGYCNTFIKRYPSIKSSRCKVIPFGIADKDVEVMRQYVKKSDKVILSPDKINIVYAGRGGYDMAFALQIIFSAVAKGLAENNALFNRLHFWFVGTSYANAGSGKKTILPIAASYGLAEYVTEITDRIPYFETLFVLDKAAILLVPGSTDSTYTASKIYPYIILKKKLLAVFKYNSSVVNLLRQLQYGELVTFDHTTKSADNYTEDCYRALCQLLSPGYSSSFDDALFEPHKAFAKTKGQADFLTALFQPGGNL
ncbi:MAG: glycosyltransferase [Chitinophagaceae bacterium]|nr:glycosyltransferase [Chitinophagaceae bacterium]